MVNRVVNSSFIVESNHIMKQTGASNSIEQFLENEEQNISNNNLPQEKASKMTDSMNKFLDSTNTQLRFKFHEELNTYYVTLIDANTEEIVREIPSKKLMDMYAAMRDFVGFFVDEKI